MWLPASNTKSKMDALTEYISRRICSLPNESLTPTSNFVLFAYSAD